MNTITKAFIPHHYTTALHPNLHTNIRLPQLYDVNDPQSQPTSPSIKLDTFDFSSKKGWDDFYRQLDDDDDDDDDAEELTDNAGNNPMDDGTFEFEWHSSVPHDFVISEIEMSSNVLMVGTGNSKLPRALYDAHNHNHDGGETIVVCMDYSQPCVDMLEQLHRVECPSMYFICGDAMDLSSAIQDHLNLNVNVDLLASTSNQEESELGLFDYVVDKGLMDAMMCNEGCDLDQYFREVKNVLKPGGKMILVSYKLNTATKEFLQSNELGLHWDLDIKEKSNSRVSFSIGQLT